MGCLCSICICKRFSFGHKYTGKRLRRSHVFSCCGKRKINTAECITSDSFLRKQMAQTSEDTDLLSKQDTHVTLQEEVECSPESSQQLEPEIFNCAADLSLYKRTNSLLSGSNNGQDIENGEKPDDFLVTEDLSTNYPQGIMAFEPPSSAVVGQITNRSSGEWATAGDGNTDTRSLPEGSKRSKLLQDLQPQGIDGDGADSGSEQTLLSYVPAPVNSYEDSRDHIAEKNEMAYAPSHLSQEPQHDTTNTLSHIATDGVSSSKTTQRTDTKEIVGQACPLEKHLPLDVDEDLYRDEEEIEKDKIQKVAATTEKYSEDTLKLGVGPEVDIIEYCQREWRGKTTVAKKMKEGYEEVANYFCSIRRVRGDNYCALRATLFQCLSQSTKLPQWLDDDDLTELPEKLIKKYDWIKLWRFWHSYGSKKTWVRIKKFLELLKKKWAELSEIKSPNKKQEACNEIFQREEEYCLYEAVKFLMLKTAIDLYNANEDGKEVPVFSWLLFARNTSNNPCEFMKNHLNQVGHTGGLEQVEMFLLGYALQYTIKVYRLYKYGTDEFVTQYPNDQANWPVVTLITEDDRHYNVPVRVCEETRL